MNSAVKYPAFTAPTAAELVARVRELPITDENGELIDQGLALIPRDDLAFEETWFVAGMKSSGSNCLIAADVFVPGHRIMLVPPAIEGRYATERTEEELYRSAFVPLLALVLAGPAARPADLARFGRGRPARGHAPHREL